MKATLSYKSKRNIIIASVIVVLLAAISTAGYFYIKGNDETARAFTQNEITNELTPGEQTQNNGGQQENQPQNPEQPATPGEQNNNGGEQTNNGQNQNNNQNRPNNNTTNNGSTPNQTTGNVPNQEYVTERTEERTTITKEYSVEWTPESITANASVQNLNIIRPIISANKSADKNAVVPGETITYTITVTNTGNADGKAIVKDTIPEATEFIENSIKVNGEDTNYTAQNLEEGITVDVAKQNEQGEAGTVKVEFKVKVSNIFAQYEKASIINQATVNEEKTNEVKNPVIKFEKSANKEKVEVGDTVTYTISIENIGDAEGTVIVKDTIPTGTKLVENSTIKLNGEDTNYTEQILNDGIELKVKSGERLEITFEVEVLSEITEAVKNTAYVNDIPTETIPTQVESLIKFESNGGTLVESMNGYTGDVIENREMPTTTREGYTFDGWYAEPELTNKVETLPEKYPAGTTTYYAKWTKNSYKITYKIVGDYFTNNNYKEETLEYGAQITPEANPTQEGYTFSGWLEIPETMPAHDVEVVGSYTKNSYKITYKIVGDYFTNNNYKEETLEYGAQITPEANPTQEGYTFSGWSEIPETMPAHDVVVEGSYTINNYQYKVQYWYENEHGSYEHLATVPGGEVPYGTVIDTFTPRDNNGGYVLDHVDPAKSATDNKTANLVITHKESENILNVYYKRNSFNYKIEYYKEIANGEEFITSTGNKQQKLKTKITDEILKADFGANWKNANKPQEGYQDGIVENAESTNYYITIKESNNVIKVVYKLKTNIEYTVKYYFNEVPLKEDSGTAKYGQQINSVNDYSDGVWIKDEQKSTSLPYTIKESGNVIKVYYVKPDIKAKKTIWQDSTKLNDNAIVEAGSTVTYKITASNAGYLAGNVTIKDEELPQGNVTNITATGHTETLTVQDLKDGIVLNVPARGTAEVTITIKLTGAIGTPISNTAKYDNTETNKVENNVEKTVALKAKAEQVQVLNTNVILVMDISFSMNDRPVCTDHTTEKEHRDAGCGKRGDTWLKKDKKIDIAKTVINKFIDSVKLPDQATTDSSIIEVIKFNGWPDVVGEASNSQSKSDLKAKVNRLDATGGTWYSRPLAMTTEEITKLTKERPDNRNIVIFVSDGEPAEVDKTIKDEADKLKAVPNTTVYTVGFDADIEILKQIATDYGKYRTTDQASSLNTIFNEIVDEIAIKTEEKQSVSGRIELSNVDLNKTNKVVIKVNGTAISADKVQAAIVTENSKYYIDLNKLNLSSLRDDVLIEYFINE